MYKILQICMTICVWKSDFTNQDHLNYMLNISPECFSSSKFPKLNDDSDILLCHCTCTCAFVCLVVEGTEGWLILQTWSEI